MAVWILAYDAECPSGAEIGPTIREAAGARVAVVPLTNDRVRLLRQQAFGVSAPWTPTLFAVDREVVTAWTGFGMCVNLCRVLGVRRGSRAIRGLRRTESVRTDDPARHRSTQHRSHHHRSHHHRTTRHHSAHLSRI